MPLPFGSFCVLRVTWAPDVLLQQKKNNKQKMCDSFSAWLLISWFSLFVSPCHLVTSSWEPCSRLFLVCSSIACSLISLLSPSSTRFSLPCFVFAVLVRALSFCSCSARLFVVQFIFQFCAFPLLGTALQLFSGLAPFFLTQVDRLLIQ